MNDSPSLPRNEATGLERFQQQPIIDRIDPRTLVLIQSSIAPRCDHAEVGHFLELAAHYDLDPFAKEIWCAKSKGGRLLIMVGRDGLRKVAKRNGLHMDADVVRENDEFAVARTPDGNRTVSHSYGKPADRGEIIGAWSEVREGGPKGDPKGFFYAPLDEYLPKNVDPHSPWAKQVGVMILAAAERQAARQGTPLGGLLIEGEDEVVRDALGAGEGNGEAQNIDLGPEVEAVLFAAANLGHAGLADRATAEMTLAGQSEERVQEWVNNANAELAPMIEADEAKLKAAAEGEPAGDAPPKEGEVRDAEVVPGDEPAEEPPVEPEPTADPPVEPEPAAEPEQPQEPESEPEGPTPSEVAEGLSKPQQEALVHLLKGEEGRPPSRTLNALYSRDLIGVERDGEETQPVLTDLGEQVASALAPDAAPEPQQAPVDPAGDEGQAERESRADKLAATAKEKVDEANRAMAADDEERAEALWSEAESLANEARAIRSSDQGELSA